MTSRQVHIIQAIILIFIIVVLIVVVKETSNKTFGAAPSGLYATVATSTNPSVSSTASTLFATSSCAARIITTESSAIMLTFSDFNGQTPTGTFGHWQAASTTTAYNGDIYGCGLVKVYSYTTQNITATESR